MAESVVVGEFFDVARSKPPVVAELMSDLGDARFSGLAMPGLSPPRLKVATRCHVRLGKRRAP